MKIFWAFLFFFIFCSYPPDIHAQDLSLRTQEVIEGKVTAILEEKEIEVMGHRQWYQRLEVTVPSDQENLSPLEIEHGHLPVEFLPRYAVGDLVKIQKSEDAEGKPYFYISDYVRRTSIYSIWVLFTICTIIVARWRGIMAMISMGYSFFIIFWFILPRLLAGGHPVMVAVMGSALIIPVTFFLSHGVNKKTLASVLGTIISLSITGLLASWFVHDAHLTGMSSEESSFLHLYLGKTIQFQGLLLAGIIIGTLGVMDDSTISQAAIVEQLYKTRSLSIKHIFFRSLSVGHDHIASLVNTLVLVYAGASLPLLLLFTNTQTSQSLLHVIDMEIVSEEIVRTLVGSIGLIIAVPITTVIACILYARENRN